MKSIRGFSIGLSAGLIMSASAIAQETTNGPAIGEWALATDPATDQEWTGLNFVEKIASVKNADIVNLGDGWHWGLGTRGNGDNYYYITDENNPLVWSLSPESSWMYVMTEETGAFIYDFGTEGWEWIGRSGDSSVTYPDASFEEAIWSYEGENGPASWGGLDPDYALMDEGMRQSPIDISETTDNDSLASLDLDYKSTPISVTNNGHTVQQNYASGSSVTVDGKTYDLLQFHFHSKSEHTIGGEHFPLEMHCVHSAEDGSLLVIGILFEAGEENPTLQKVWDHIPSEAGATYDNADVMVNAADVIGDPSGFYQYSGSLTTPPGTEGVSWYVLSEPRQLSAEQIEAFQKFYDENYRPTQPLNGRDIFRRRTKM